MKKIYFLIILVPAIYLSQTKEERRKIGSHSDIPANIQLLSEIGNIEAEKADRVKEYLKKYPDVQRVVKFGKYGLKELRDISASGDPIYVSTYNTGASATARANRLYSGGSLGLNIQGQNMTAGIWDGGVVRATHQEFLQGMFSKVNVVDSGPIGDHGTHVAGTIAATGVNPTVRGVAFNASLTSYNWTNDLSEMLIEAQGGMLVSNHSYGPLLSNDNQIGILGAYGNDARLVDNLCYNNPYYLPVFAAGNNRNDTTAPYATQLGTKSGYDLIAGDAIGKNVLTVAAVQNVPNYTGSSSVIMSTFSNYGPSDDGRIKPEISTKGVNVISTVSSSDTAIGSNSGTSMAAPGVTGVVLLLQQYHNLLYSDYMRAATVKGLIMHTADEAGTSAGPDYSFGWGLINAESSAVLIRDKNLGSGRSIIEENTLASGATFTKSIVSSGSQPLKVSISWTDPQFNNANTSAVDPSTKYLVNDLDIKVTSSTGTVYYPWKLQGMGAPSNPATNVSTNDVDNFERVDIPGTPGTYTITVTHKGTLTGGPQNFSLIASGGSIATLSTADANSKSRSIRIYPNPASDWINFDNNGEDATAVILDASGKFIRREVIKHGKISIKDLTTGNYMLLYSDKKSGNETFKFIKR